MTCSACGGELAPGASRCPSCQAAVAPRVEGALATDPRLVTPPARSRSRAADVSREPAILRRRDGSERTWQAEIQERVRSRRQRRVATDLPLFDQPEIAAAQPAEDSGRGSELRPPRPVVPVTRPGVPESRVTRATAVAPAVEERVHLAPPAERARTTPASEEPQEDAARSAGLTDAELADLPLRTTVPASVADRDYLDHLEFEAGSLPAQSAHPTASVPVLVVHSDPHEGLELEPPPSEPAPLERPASALERAQAAAFDLALFAVLSAVAAYFAARAARVEMLALAASWPWLASFLALVAVFYACYFTGTTGQTPGKLLLGLRVVDTAGRRPSYPVATARALLGLAGIALCGLGLLPIVFDPAGRALHDRAFRTRVVRR